MEFTILQEFAELPFAKMEPTTLQGFAQLPFATQLSSLTDLPEEIQLEILRSCLVTDAEPLIDFGYLHRRATYEPYSFDFAAAAARGTLFLRAYNEVPGQSLIPCIGIIFTCRLYYAEGLKTFWKSNRFLYSIDWMASALHNVLSQQLVGLSWLCHLILRPTVHTHEDVPRHVQTAIHAIATSFPLLKTLTIEFVNIREGFLEAAKLIASRGLPWVEYVAQSEIEYAQDFFDGLRHDPNRHSNQGNLESVTMTGMDYHHLSFFAQWLISVLVRPTGVLALGLGQGGERYSMPFDSLGIPMPDQCLYRLTPRRTLVLKSQLKAWITENKRRYPQLWISWNWDDYTC